MIQKLFLRPFVRRRMAASHLGIILEQFALDLQTRGYAVSTVRMRAVNPMVPTLA